jgi:bacillithiol system protein YtxJ
VLVQAPADRSWIPVEDATSLDALLQQSHQAPVVLFLHDWTCPISERAEDQVGRIPGTVYSVDVTRLHDLNRHIALVTGVGHESPQVLVFAGGRVVFDASHGRIRAEVLTALLEELALP